MYAETSSWFKANVKTVSGYKRCSYCKFMSNLNKYFNLMYTMKLEEKIANKETSHIMNTWSSLSDQASFDDPDNCKENKYIDTSFNSLDLFKCSKT